MMTKLHVDIIVVDNFTGYELKYFEKVKCPSETSKRSADSPLEDTYDCVINMRKKFISTFCK